MDAPAQSRSAWMGFPVPDFPPLTRDLEADVCIVGAGIAGLSTAYLLGKKGYRVVVIDDGPIGGGMSGRTTAHLSSAIDDRFYELERVHGEEGARLAAESHAAAIDAIEAIVAHERIDCDFARVDGYLFIPRDGEPDELVREYGAALRSGVEDLVWVDRAPIPDYDTGRCLRFPRQGQFHPLKYLSGLAHAIVRDGGRIFCGVHAQEVTGGDKPEVRTRGGHRIACRDVVVATNTPISDRVAIHTKQAPYTTYVVALRVPKGTVETALYWDTLDAYHYVRLDKPEGDVLIVGGEDHKTGQADDAERRWANLELWARERFPMAREVVQRWSGMVMEPIDYLAFIGRDPGEAHRYVATGDSGHGMTHGTLAGIILTDLIHGSDIAWAKLYDPSRKPLKAAREFARENANVAWQYTDWLRGGEVEGEAQVPAGTGAVIRRGMHRIAVYRDAQGELHEMSARCTHLGCSVRWNPADNTWDCKCHGSRFNALGRVITGPAVSDLEPAEVPVAPRGHPARPEAPPPRA